MGVVLMGMRQGVCAVLLGSLLTVVPAAHATDRESDRLGTTEIAGDAGTARAAASSTSGPSPRTLPTHGDDTVPARSIPGLPDVQARAAVPGRVKVLAMRLYWGKKPARPTTEQGKKVLSDSAAWFKQVSRGRHTMRYKLTPWLKVSAGASTMCEYWTNGVSIALKRAKRAGYAPAKFNRYMLVMPQCGTNSLGEMPGRVTWIRQVPDLDVVVHELGHNLGLDHANSKLCKKSGRAVTWSKKCYEEEYGDVWDAMGISSQPYSTPVLARLGWVGKVKTPKGSGTFTLKPAEKPGKGVQAIKLRTSGRTYWLEYRTATRPLAAWKDVKGRPGLQIRADLGRRSMYLLDAAPGLASPYLLFPSGESVDPALPLGGSFTTPERVRIQVLSQTADALKVKITRGYKAKAPDAPTLQWALQESTFFGETRLRVQRPASDNGQLIQGFEVTRWPSGKTTFVRSFNGERRVISVPTREADTAYSVAAVNQVGRSGASAKVKPRVPAPTVKITSPASGAVIQGHDVTVSAQVTPDKDSQSPVRYVRVCLLSIYAEPDTSCSYLDDQIDQAPWTVTLTDVYAGEYRLRVEATDDENMVGAAEQPLEVFGYSPTVTIASPASGATLDASFHVTGTTAPNATTKSPIEWIEVQLWDADGDQYFADSVTGTASYDATFTHVPRGTYTLDVSVGTQDEEYRTVTRPVTVSYPRPTWTISKPADGAALSGPDYVELETVVNRPDRLQESAYAEIRLNGEAWGYTYPESGTTWLDPSQLRTGSNTITLVVEDGWGGFDTWTADTATVTYSP